MRCPNCQHIAQGHGSDRMPGVCPACGIAYSKWRGKQTHKQELPEEGDAIAEPGPLNLGEKFYYFTCFMPSDRDESAFWGHGLIYCCFIFWGWAFILGGLDQAAINASFLHTPDQFLHGLGRNIFSVFGEITTILPGSTVQVLFPFCLMLGFMAIQRDNFAASIMLWWSGQNFIDVSGSVAGGQDTVGYIAGFCFIFGALVIILSQLWGGYLLYVEFCGRTGIYLGDESDD